MKQSTHNSHPNSLIHLDSHCLPNFYYVQRNRPSIEHMERTYGKLLPGRYGDIQEKRKDALFLLGQTCPQISSNYLCSPPYLMLVLVFYHVIQSEYYICYLQNIVKLNTEKKVNPSPQQLIFHSISFRMLVMCLPLASAFIMVSGIRGSFLKR